MSVNSSGRAIIWPGKTTDIPVDTTYDFGNHTLRIVTIMVSMMRGEQKRWGGGGRSGGEERGRRKEGGNDEEIKEERNKDQKAERLGIGVV